MMFLADENFPGPVLRQLRERGFDIQWITETAPGAADEVVLALAVQDRQTLLTFDKDFGELAFRQGLPATSGVVLFRLADLPLDGVTAVVLSVVASDIDWAGMFTVVTRDRIRRIPLPHLQPE